MRFPPRGQSDSLRGSRVGSTLGGGWLSVVPPMPVLRSSELLHVSSVGMTPARQGTPRLDLRSEAGRRGSTFQPLAHLWAL